MDCNHSAAVKLTTKSFTRTRSQRFNVKSDNYLRLYTSRWNEMTETRSVDGLKCGFPVSEF
jgi:hypothetical protein